MNERLTWIPLSHRKGISQVSIIVKPYNNQIYGGFSTTTKILVVVEKPPWSETQCIASTIAHEYRHHIQRELNLFKNINSTIRSDLEYEKSIHWYFNNYRHEMDALLFEYKVAKSELNHWWLKHLVTPK